MSRDEVNIDQFHQHEVLHTAHIITSMFEDYVVTHPYTQSDPGLQTAAENVSVALANFYQLVGQKNLPRGQS